jgi:hypothetical protein
MTRKCAVPRKTRYPFVYEKALLCRRFVWFYQIVYLRIDGVTSGAGFGMHDGKLFAYKPVEKRRFANVWAPDYGELYEIFG